MHFIFFKKKRPTGRPIGGLSERARAALDWAAAAAAVRQGVAHQRALPAQAGKRVGQGAAGRQVHWLGRQGRGDWRGLGGQAGGLASLY